MLINTLNIIMLNVTRKIVINSDIKNVGKIWKPIDAKKIAEKISFIGSINRFICNTQLYIE
jgi:predicted TIM-barrel enzyme